jgi:hypothetical protein
LALENELTFRKNISPNAHVSQNRLCQTEPSLLFGIFFVPEDGDDILIRNVEWLSIQSQRYITTDSQSASLSRCQAPTWNLRPIFPNLSLIIFRQLRVCWCEAPSLTRSRVCTFQFLLGIASAAFLRSESHGTHKHILLSLFVRHPQLGGPGPCIYFSQEQGSPGIPPGTRLCLPRNYKLQL